MKKHLISVIIPVYNVEKYLPRCLDSVVAQTYTNLEIILVDDGSTDTSGKICDEYAKRDARIKVIHKQNGGVSSARNAALKICTGQYVGFVDSDDYIERDMFEYLLNLIISSKADLARCEIIGKNNLFIKAQAIKSSDALEKCLPNIYLWNMLFPRDIIANLSFDEDIFFGEDMKFCVEVFAHTNLLTCGEKAKYHYCINPQSLTKMPFDKKKLTYFKANNFILEYSKNKQVRNKIRAQKAYHAVGFLRQIIETDFQEKETINTLIGYIKTNFWPYFCGNFKLSNKLFAIICCINFNWASIIYRRIFNK